MVREHARTVRVSRLFLSVSSATRPSPLSEIQDRLLKREAEHAAARIGAEQWEAAKLLLRQVLTEMKNLFIEAPESRAMHNHMVWTLGRILSGDIVQHSL